MFEYRRIVSKWLFVIVMCCHGFVMAADAGAGVTEARLKSAFIKNVVNFVSWEQAEVPLNICVQGDREVFLELTAFYEDEEGAAQTAVSWIQLPAKIDHCNALYLTDLNAGEQKRLLSAMPGNSPLTISDLPAFAKFGGMVELIRDGNRFRYEVNYKSVSNAGLNVDGRLLRLASWVHTHIQMAEQ